MQKAIGDSNEKPKLSEDEQNEIRVIGVVKAKAKDVEGTFDTVDAGINDARDELAEVRLKLEALRKARGAVPKESDTRSLIKVSPNPAQEEEPFPQTPLIPQAPLKSWKELEAEGRAAFPESVSWDLVLTPQEQARIEAELDALREAFDAKHRLDTIDWSIAYLAGICGGLIDWLLVKIPKTSNATNTQSWAREKRVISLRKSKRGCRKTTSRTRKSQSGVKSMPRCLMITQRPEPVAQDRIG